jgi:hypothetical protein
MNGLDPDGQPSFAALDRVPIIHWKQQVERAIQECDPADLKARVYDAEWAIFQRWQELGAHGGSIEERIAMAVAVDDLLSIMIHKLNWPDFRVNS